MSLLKRLTATVSASVENVVTRVENHDAIIDASLKECRRAAAKTRHQLGRLHRESEALRIRRERTVESIEQWKQRAVACAASDENRALQCVKKLQEAESEVASLDGVIVEQQKLEARLKTRLKTVEERISEVSRQRTSMRCRQSTAEAMKIMEDLGLESGISIDETFDRWELSLVEYESDLDSALPEDTLEAEFVAEEEAEALKLALATLVRKTDNGEAGNE